MHMSRSWAFLGATLLLAYGCVDAVVAPDAARDLELFVPSLVHSRTAAGADTTTRPHRELTQEDADPSLTQPTSITVRADAGFNGTTAYGQSLVNYWANTARSTATLGIRYNNANVGSTSATESASFTLPAWRSLVANATYAVSTCGNTANVGASGVAWNEMLSLTLSPVVFGRIESSDIKAAAQAACESQQPIEGGGGSGGGAVGGGSPDGGGSPMQWYICYYTDYYWNGFYVGSILWGCSPI